jgi:FO synthase
VSLDAAELLGPAQQLRAQGKGTLVTYSPKVFIPLTKLCRDVCHYCTFAQPPRRGERAFLTADDVLAIAQAGAEAGCREALFTLGDKPELRHRAARGARPSRPRARSTISPPCALNFLARPLLPHVNPGMMVRPTLRFAALSASRADAGERF